LSPEQFALVIGAITALVIAVTGLYRELAGHERRMLAKMEELLEESRSSSAALGTPLKQSGEET